MFVRGGWVDVQFPSVQCWYLYPLCPVLTGHWSAQECDKSPPTHQQPSPAQPSRGAAVNVIVKICPCCLTISSAQFCSA